MAKHEAEADSPELIAAKAELDKVLFPAPPLAKSDEARRRIYNAAIAVLAIVSTWQGVTAISAEQWTAVIEAVAQLVVFGLPLILARLNVRNRG